MDCLETSTRSIGQWAMLRLRARDFDENFPGVEVGGVVGWNVELKPS